MRSFDSIGAILDHAIELEQQAVDLYTRLATKTTNEVLRQVFLGFADEERGHKAKLQGVKAGRRFASEVRPVQDLKIADYANPVVLSDDPTYADILVFAMKQEKQAFRLYVDLADRAANEELRTLFLALAQEEAKHKLRFEVEYDQHVLTEN